MNCRIKALLILKQKKQADIARELCVSKSAVSQTVSGRATSRRIQLRIAKVLAMTVDELWPDNNKAA